MKSSIKILFAATLLVFVGSCKKDNLEEARPVNIHVQLTVDESEIWFDVPYEKAHITLVNKSTNNTYEIQADETGQIVLNNLAPGRYSINVSLEIGASEYSRLTGIFRDDDFYLNYSLTDRAFFADESIEIKLITTEILRGFVIKQIYYAGSHTTDAAVNRDNFIEIYNNSDGVLYADSLAIVLVYGKANKNTDEYSLPNNQYDWSKSLNMNVPDDANEDYVYAKGIFMIPSDGTGRQHPVQPGQSIVVAGSALNHAGSYTNNEGKIIGAQKPELTVDLSNADFEVWLYPYEQKIQPGRSMWANDVDNPGVKNLDVFFALSMRDMFFPPQARESFALMKMDGSIDLENLPAYALPTVRTVTSSTTLYPQLPARYIVDAVELEDPIAAAGLPRRLPQRFDAGATSVPGGPYSSQSVVRKTLKIVSGRRILKDTNNSTNDFGVLTKANPYKGVDSFID